MVLMQRAKAILTELHKHVQYSRTDRTLHAGLCTVLHHKFQLHEIRTLVLQGVILAPGQAFCGGGKEGWMDGM